MQRIIKDHGPDAFAGISSIDVQKERYVFQKMIRAAVGTNSGIVVQKFATRLLPGECSKLSGLVLQLILLKIFITQLF